MTRPLFTKADLRKRAQAILKAVGYRTLRDLHRVVIKTGYTGSDFAASGDVAGFNRLQTAYHAASGLIWAAETSEPDRRSQWMHDAGRRLADIGLDVVV